MRQDVYRVAYDEAITELSEILNKFEQLRLRKERIEKAMDVLKPLLGQSAPASLSDMNPAGPSPEAAPPMMDPSPTHTAEQQSAAVPSAVMQRIEEPISYPAPQAADNSSDPFQRRINNALRQGFSSGESREFARSFAGSLLRGR